MTKNQFKIIHGSDKSKWAKSVLAVYDVLFNGYTNTSAAVKHDITRQTVGQALAFNEVKHHNMLFIAKEYNSDEVN